MAVTTTGCGASGYRLDLRAGPLPSDLDRGEFHRVEHLEPWADLVGQNIAVCDVHRLPPGPRVENGARIPCSLALGFEAGVQVSLICGGWRGPRPQSFPAVTTSWSCGSRGPWRLSRLGPSRALATPERSQTSFALTRRTAADSAALRGRSSVARLRARTPLLNRGRPGGWLRLAGAGPAPNGLYAEAG